MALKILTGAKPFLDAHIKPFDITEIEILPAKLKDYDFFSSFIIMAP